MHCAFIDHIARTTTGFAHSEMSEGGRGGEENSNGNNLDVLFKIARGNTGSNIKKIFRRRYFLRICSQTRGSERGLTVLVRRRLGIDNEKAPEPKEHNFFPLASLRFPCTHAPPREKMYG